MDYTIKDSTLHHDPASFKVHDSRDSALKVGIVRDVYQAYTEEIKYIVEIQQSNITVPVVCSLMTRWGGVQNFEEYGLRTYKGSSTTDNMGAAYKTYDTKVGDVVIVAFLQGNYRDGVILGGIRHPARKPEMTADDITYRSQYNGIETTITDKGAYRVTNKAILSQTLSLAVPGLPVPPAVFNPTVAGSYFELGDDGSWTVTDNLQQTLKIDKTSQKTTITSGKCSITLDFLGLTTAIEAPKITVTGKISTDIVAPMINMEAKISAKLKATKIAIGNDAFELIDGLIQLIDALGTSAVMSPNGPCNPLNTVPSWPQVLMLKAKLTAIKGSL